VTLHTSRTRQYLHFNKQPSPHTHTQKEEEEEEEEDGEEEGLIRVISTL
jgi:hypothetical protein